MKILYLVDSRSGFSRKWCNTFSKTDNEIYLLSFFEFQELSESVNKISLNSKITGHRLKYLLNYFKIKRIINQIKPDIIHAIQVTRQGFLAALINYHPFIVTAIGSDIFVEPKNSFVEKMIVQYSFNKADCITTMAEHMTNYIKENFNIDENKIISFPWGCDTNVFNLKNSIFNNNNNNNNADDNEIFIISTRNMKKKLYNQELIINSLQKIINKYPNVKFVFIGDGYLRPKYEEMVTNLNLENNCEFLGWQTPEQIAKWLKKSMIFVSSARSDGNNISLNEAMACGCFPICTDIPANRQWYNEGESGFFVHPDKPDELAKKIIIAIENKELRERAIDINAQTVSDRGDWHKQAKKMMRIYEKVVSKNSILA